MSELTGQIIIEVKKVICGKDEVIKEALMCILASGHLLIEDVPGVGKTTLALAFSKTMGLDYGRVQFTPDVLPSDITGFSILDKNTGAMKYQPGSIFHNLFLADELNRASSRTQSALLEAMEEGNVTVDGKTYLLPKPFTVFATQNPAGASGTSLLPDSQIDRFMVRISMGYPSLRDELHMLEARANGTDPLDSITRICTREALVQMQQEVDKIFMNGKILRYIVTLVNATRESSYLERGASPRATLAIAAMAKASAYLFGRNYVTPPDVKSVFIPVIAHRLILTPESEIAGLTTEKVAEEILSEVPVPKV